MGDRFRRLLWVVWVLSVFIAFAVPGFAAETAVDPRSGRLMATAADIIQPAGAQVLELRRSHDGVPRAGGILGEQWYTNWDVRLLRGEAGTVILDGGAAIPMIDPSTVKELSGGGASVKRDDASVDVFDAQGRLTSRTDETGRSFTLSYDLLDRLSRVAADNGDALLFEYDESNHVIEARTHFGGFVKYLYESGRISHVTCSDGSTIGYEYGDGAALSQVIDPASGNVRIARDAEGRVASRTWADGTSESWSYADNSTTHTDEVGALTAYKYSADGRTTTIMLANGTVEETEVDEQGRLVRIKAPGGETRFLYDEKGRLATTETAEGTTVISYAGEGSRVESTTHPDGTTETIEYNVAKLPAAVSINGQVVSRMTYSPAGLPTLIEGEGGMVRHISYDEHGRATKASDSLGRTTTYQHDGAGRLIRETNPAGGVTAFEYNNNGRLAAIVDPAGRRTGYAYDGAGRLASVTEPGGLVYTYKYDSRGRRIATTAGGQTTEHSFDAKSLTATTRLPGGGTDAVSFDASGGRMETTSPLGLKTVQEFDDAGNLASVIAPGGSTTKFQRDGQGRLVAVENGAFRTDMQWDPMGRLTAMKDSSGGSSTWSFDEQGNVSGETNALGQSTRFTRDALGRITGTQSAADEAASFIYDSEGQLVTMRRPSGAQVDFQYDALGNQVRSGLAGEPARAIEYDAAGFPTSTISPSGSRINFTYDDAGRLATKQLPGGVKISYSHLPTGELTRVNDPRWPMAFEYDSVGRLMRTTHETLKASVSLERGTDGLVTALHTTDGQTIGYDYDGLKRVSAIKLPGGQLLELAHGTTGLSAAAFGSVASGKWTFDPAGRLVSLIYTVSGKRIASWSMKYDAAGRPTEIVRDDAVTNIDYDADGRIVSERGAAPRAYTYGPGGNRLAVEGATVKDFAYDLADRLVSAGDASIEHDPDGNIARRTDSAGEVAYNWDAEGRLVKVTQPGGAVTEFGYTDDGDRAWRRDASGLTRFVYFDGQLLEEINEAGKVTSLYIHGPGVDWPLAMVRDGRVSYILTDPFGNVAMVLDDTGKVKANYELDAFGVIVESTGDLKQPFLYHGREYEPGIGLHWFRQRWYDASLGRFLSPDSELGNMEVPASLNPYVFAMNAPTVFGDPSGAAAQSRIDFNYWYDRYGIRAQDLLNAARGEYNRLVNNPHNPLPEGRRANRVERGVRYNQAAGSVQSALERAEMMPDRFRKGPHMMRSLNHQLSGNGPVGSLLPPKPQTGYKPLTQGMGHPVPTRGQEFRDAVRGAIDRIGNWFKPGGGSGGGGGEPPPASPGGGGTRAMQAPRVGDTQAMNAPGTGGAGGILRGVGGSALGGGIAGAVINGVVTGVQTGDPRKTGEAVVSGGVSGAAVGAVVRVAHNGVMAAAAGSTRPAIGFLAPRAVPFIAAVHTGYTLGTAAGNWWKGNTPDEQRRLQEAEQRLRDALAQGAALLENPDRVAATAANASVDIKMLVAECNALEASRKALETATEEASRIANLLDAMSEGGAEKFREQNPELKAVTDGPGGKSLSQWCTEAARTSGILRKDVEQMNTGAETILKAFETEAEPPDSTPALKVAEAKLQEMADSVDGLVLHASDANSAMVNVETGFTALEAVKTWQKAAMKDRADFNTLTDQMQTTANALDGQKEKLEAKKDWLRNTITSLQGRVPAQLQGLFAAPLAEVAAVKIPDPTETIADARFIVSQADKVLDSSRSIIDDIVKPSLDEEDEANNVIAGDRETFGSASGKDASAEGRKILGEKMKDADATLAAIEFVVASRRQKINEWIVLANFLIDTMGPDKVADAEAKEDSKTKKEAEELMAAASQQKEEIEKESVVVESIEKKTKESKQKMEPAMNLLGVGGG